MEKMKIITLEERARCEHCDKTLQKTALADSLAKEFYCSFKCARGTSYLRTAPLELENVIINYKGRFWN